MCVASRRKKVRCLSYHKTCRLSLRRPDGEIGRRSGLKIRRPQGRGGSSPPLGTNKFNGLQGPQRLQNMPAMLELERFGFAPFQSFSV